MSDEIQTALEARIDEIVESSDDAQADSERDSDTDSEIPESEESEETSDTDSEDVSDQESETKSDDEKEVEFDFHKTSVSTQHFIAKLSALPEKERIERISRLTRETEIDAARKAFPDIVPAKKVTVDEHTQALIDRLDRLEKLQNPDQLEKALQIAQKLQATETLTDTRMKQLMLQEQFGESAKDVMKDTKFIVAYEKFPTLSIEERLEYACSLSPVAKKLATENEVDKQVRLRNTKTVSKGSVVAPKKITAADVNSIEDFEKYMEARFNG